MTFDIFFDRLTTCSIFILITSVIGFGGYCALKAISADGISEYCYVTVYGPLETNPIPVYTLHGYRNWRDDRVIGKFDNINDAVTAAEKISCKVEAR